MAMSLKLLQHKQNAEKVILTIQTLMKIFSVFIASILFNIHYPQSNSKNNLKPSIREGCLINSFLNC